LISTNGPHSGVSFRVSRPLSVGTTFAAIPMVISETNPTVIACRMAP
jgi:hypothetical protein